MSNKTSRGLAATIVGVALFGGLIGVAADRWAVTNNVALPTETITAPKIGPLAAPEDSIQQIIRRGDEEQAQAFAGNDPSVMQDTSTSDFYQSQASTNEDLRAN